MKSKTFIVSLGGSLIVPDQVDTGFLKKFKFLVENYVAKGYRFVLITGGGKTCRRYQDAARKIKNISLETADWIGIYTTHLNAMLVHSIFNDAQLHLEDPSKKFKPPKNIVISAGWKPGHSSDMDAVLLAKNLGADTIINLSNIDYAYDKDPRKFKDAKKLTDVSWVEFRKIVGHKWVAGLNAPFDPIASKVCEQYGLKVIIAHGKKLKNFENILKGKPFKGTLIH